MTEEKESVSIEELKKKHYKLTDKVVSDLTSAFNNDFTVEEACLYAGIVKDTYYNWLKLSDEFDKTMQRAQMFVFYAAKRNVAKAVNNGSLEDSWKLLSKRQKQLYSDRIEQTGKDGAPIETSINLTNFENLDESQLQGLAGEQVTNERESQD